MLSIGLMSGSSQDGIDAALIKTNGCDHIEELGHASLDYHADFKILLKAAEYTVRQSHGDMDKAESSFLQTLKNYLQDLKLDVPHKINELSTYLHTNYPPTLQQVIQHSTDLHGSAVEKLLKETKREANDIDVVGYHGQTLFHKPAEKISIIVGDGQRLADQLGIRIVNDFRKRDVESGGQGAPFAPLYHQALAIRDKKIPVAVVNCGGIANITLISSENPQDLIAFDTGPGNGLIDALVRQRTQGQEHMDKDGQYGKKGKVNASVLKALYEKSIIVGNKNYFSMPAPKSLDIGDLHLIPELDSLSLEDACATLEAFTAERIINSLDRIAKTFPTHWILAGGGWNNPVILQELENRLAERCKGKDKVKIQTADQAGWNSKALEAQIFAYLAVRSLQNQPLSMPGTTGVPKAMTGGTILLPALMLL